MSRDSNSPVTIAEFHRILTRINDALYVHSQAIENLKVVSRESYRERIFQNTNRIAQIENHLGHIRDDMQELRGIVTEQVSKLAHVAPSTSMQDIEQRLEENDVSSEIRDIDKRLRKLERLERTEEYDQTNLERDFEILQREFEIAQRQIRNMEYKLNKL